MILHTGNRTDIPAFYSEWFCNRLREGYVLVRNPYNEKAVTRYELNPQLVDLIVFCTKNPIPLVTHLDELSAFGQLWYVTITPYGKGIEPGVPDKIDVIDAFKKISARCGKDSCIWRYDPIMIHEKYTRDQHLKSFEKMCAALSSFTETCVFSFVELYEKVKKNFPGLREVCADDQRFLAERLSKIAAGYGIRLTLCGQSKISDQELRSYGVDVSGCMTQAVMQRALHTALTVPPHKAPRAECACYLGFDIGAYNSCAHFCRYCYANSDRAKVMQNMRNHNPASPFLIGGALPGDEVHQAVQFSFRNGQNELFSF